MAYQTMPAKPAVGAEWSAMGDALATNVTQLVADAQTTVPVDRLPAGSVISTTSASTRPTARTDIAVVFRTATPPTSVWLTSAGDRWQPTS